MFLPYLKNTMLFSCRRLMVLLSWSFVFPPICSLFLYWFCFDAFLELYWSDELYWSAWLAKSLASLIIEANLREFVKNYHHLDSGAWGVVGSEQQSVAQIRWIRWIRTIRCGVHFCSKLRPLSKLSILTLVFRCTVVLFKSPMSKNTRFLISFWRFGFKNTRKT